MPVTIIHAGSMTGDGPPGDAYADHELAMVYSSLMRFSGGTPTSTGVFPDTAVQDIDGTDKYHVHAISLGGIIWRVSVTFLLKGEHIGNAFYWPTPTRSKTFSRFCTRLPKFSDKARDLADNVLQAFFDACAKTPGKTANETLLATINEHERIRRETEEHEAQQKKVAATAPVVVSSSAKDRSLFGQGISVSVMSDEQAQAKIDTYMKATGVKLDVGENRAIRVALKEGRSKDKWTSFVQKYYDGIMA
jgi:hypothetical protein